MWSSAANQQWQLFSGLFILLKKLRQVSHVVVAARTNGDCPSSSATGYYPLTPVVSASCPIS